MTKTKFVAVFAGVLTVLSVMLVALVLGLRNPGAGLGGSANANDYVAYNNQIWYVKQSSEPTLLTASNNVIECYPVGFCQGSQCYNNGTTWKIDEPDAYNSSGTLLSTYPTRYFDFMGLYDSVRDLNTYAFCFAAGNDDWPTTWPHKLKANYSGVNFDGVSGNDTAEYTVTLGTTIDSDWASDPISALTIATGVTITRPGADASQHVGGTWVTKTLPSGTYVDGYVNAKKSGVNWTDFTVKIIEAGTTDYIVYMVGASAVDGTGKVVINKNGTNYDSPITVN